MSVGWRSVRPMRRRSEHKVVGVNTAFIICVCLGGHGDFVVRKYM